MTNVGKVVSTKIRKKTKSHPDRIWRKTMALNVVPKSRFESAGLT